MSDVYDVIIVGGGIVGCAVLSELTSHGYSCLLLEKNEHLVSEASSGNSGMLHTGFDAPPGSLELQCIQYTFGQIFQALQNLGLPFDRKGATMVAWTEEQASKLPLIIEKSKLAGLSDVTQISTSELYMKEPGLNKTACSALWIPGETVVDPWLTAISLAHTARMKGAKILASTMFQECSKLANRQWKVTTSRGTFNCRLIINCSGLYGDIVDKLADLHHFSIKPVKGQYAVYSKSTNHLINSSILPIPTEKTKGEIIFQTVYGNVIVGPTAEDQTQRTRPGSDVHTITRLVKYGESLVPGLRGHPIIRTYTGVRPATETKDYHIDSYVSKSWITVGGIRSTGLSGSLGIGHYVHQLIKDQFYLEPSRTSNVGYRELNSDFKSSSEVVIDDIPYTVTHPITLAGKTSNISRL